MQDIEVFICKYFNLRDKCTISILELQTVFFEVAGSSSLDDLVYLFVCLFMNAVNKLFFKMHLLLQIWTDPYDIRHESSFRGSALGVCFSWRLGDFWRFGDLFYIHWKMVFHIRAQCSNCDVTMAALAKHKICKNDLRAHVGKKLTYTPLFFYYDNRL